MSNKRNRSESMSPETAEVARALTRYVHASLRLTDPACFDNAEVVAEGRAILIDRIGNVVGLVLDNYLAARQEVA